MFGHMFNMAKDIAFSATGKSLLNRKIDRFGKISHLEFDSNKEVIELEVILKGETAPLQVLITGYTLQKIEGKHYLRIQNIKTSREWLNQVVEDYVQNKEFNVPKKYVRLIRKVL
ncbi:MAG: Unknown protein [uncultured Sulfurovum sp.]|uniref:Uncharacterized protein n=1 Tax=uncultured Sulfurovum sp. TaxID=269237 RepID=A0A6S6U0J8_9BACT|nr:MAG: Unknown protein [uncultured Sulfurovum sp.]